MHIPLIERNPSRDDLPLWARWNGWLWASLL